MKVIICGSRELDMYQWVVDAVKESKFPITEVVSGTARGIDKLGEEYAGQHRLLIKRFPADWERYGKSAGYRRNEQMLAYADAVIAIWDGKSRGTKHSIDIAIESGKPVFVYTVIITVTKSSTYHNIG